jgi:hypothetical protein
VGVYHHGVIGDLGYLVLVVSDYAQRLVAGNSIVVTYVLGYALSALLIFLIKIFIGI